MICKNCKNGSCIFYNTIYCEHFKQVVKDIRTCQFYKTHNKYNNVKTKIDEITFDSKKEAKKYTELMILQKQGIISELQRQVRFEIVPKSETEKAAYYIADFVFKNQEGKKIIMDVKSDCTRKLPLFKLKWKLMKHLYKDYIFLIS